MFSGYPPAKFWEIESCDEISKFVTPCKAGDEQKGTSPDCNDVAIVEFFFLSFEGILFVSKYIIGCVSGSGRLFALYNPGVRIEKPSSDSIGSLDLIIFSAIK